MRDYHKDPTIVKLIILLSISLFACLRLNQLCGSINKKKLRLSVNLKVLQRLLRLISLLLRDARRLCCAATEVHDFPREPPSFVSEATVFQRSCCCFWQCKCRCGEHCIVLHIGWGQQPTGLLASMLGWSTVLCFSGCHDDKLLCSAPTIATQQLHHQIWKL